MSIYAGMNIENKSTNMIDLRSDTVTRPCEAMREAMANAIVGDDVYNDDPTVSALEEKMATFLGKEAGLFVSSGTQSNLCAVLAHCGRGEEYISGENYHIFCDEAGGAAVLGSISPHPLKPLEDQSLDPDEIKSTIKPDDYHCPITKDLFLENTVHGQVIPMQSLQDCVDVAREYGLVTHLDGARFFNAVTKMNISPQDLADPFDSVSICLSKGLGTPVGSVLVGSKAMINRARRWRKMLGGGMRQAGVLAAAGLFALEHNIKRLKEDHERAQKLAEALNNLETFEIDMARVQTNMLFFSLKKGKVQDLQAHMLERNIIISAQAPLTRIVLHKDIDDKALDQVIEGLKGFAA